MAHPEGDMRIMQYDYEIVMQWDGSVEADNYKAAVKATHAVADDIMESLRLLGVDVGVYHKPEIEVVVRGD